MLAIILASMIAAAPPGHVRMTAANAATTAALKHPRVAAAMANRMRMHAALVAGNSSGFGAGFTTDGVVNSPANNIVTAADAVRRSAAGALDYKYMHSSIEYAAPRRNDEVVFMGEETYEPGPGAMHAGKTVRRRFTDLYRQVRGKWLLSLRQATIVSVQ